jgi:hypothetical protein
MIEATIDRTTRPTELHLFDPQHVEMMLRNLIHWPDGAGPGNVMIERCWPTRDDGLTFEWSFDLGGRGRRALYGTTGPQPEGGGGPCVDEAWDTPTGLGRVFLHAPAWGVLIHTPDRDPAMPHLQHCLDSEAMTRHLGPSWMWINGHDSALPSSLTCRLLGYRPRRRATMAYCASSPGQASSTLVGKTHVKGRTQHLRWIHEQLDAELSAHSRGRVRSAACLGEVPDLRMALFCEARGCELGDAARWSSRELDCVVAALTTLHRCRIDEVAVFSVADELSVNRRWHRLIAGMHHADADRVACLVEGLLRLSEQIDPAPQCLIHRDFYGRQIIIGRRTTTILDLDTLAWGQPCLDLGNILAHVFQAGLLRGEDQRSFEALAEELLRRYEQSGGAPVDRRALAFYFASDLFRVGAIHSMRTRTGGTSPAMWSAAADAIRSASGLERGSRFRFLTHKGLPALTTAAPRHRTSATGFLQ